MTLKEFMATLRELNTKSKEKFVLTASGSVRLHSKGSILVFCPITFVCRKLQKGRFFTYEVRRAALNIKLSDRTTGTLIAVADNRGKVTMRITLLRALNLKEMEKK